MCNGVGDEITAEMAAALEKGMREYAGFWTWPDRTIAEKGVVQDWLRTLLGDDKSTHWRLGARGPGRDPPDCVVESPSGYRIGVEVSEIVDEAHAGGPSELWAPWDQGRLSRCVSDRLRRKDVPDRIQGGPYDAYVVILYTDEPMLSPSRARDWTDGELFGPFSLIDAAWLLVSPSGSDDDRGIRLRLRQPGSDSERHRIP